MTKLSPLHIPGNTVSADVLRFPDGGLVTVLRADVPNFSARLRIARIAFKCCPRGLRAIEFTAEVITNHIKRIYG